MHGHSIEQQRDASGSMSEAQGNSLYPALEPIERISEVLFGLIMVLTCTGTLSVVTADRLQIRTMLIGALGCNLAWGIIDAGMYLMSRVHEQGQNIMILRSARDSTDPEAAQRAIANALPPLLSSVLPPEQFRIMQKNLCQLPEPPSYPVLTKKDGLGAIAVCLLVFLSTFPVTLPFLFLNDARFALRLSNAIAIAMMFICGYLFGHYAGLPRCLTGALSIAIGCALVFTAIVLGG
jgi:hypothetical protein